MSPAPPGPASSPVGGIGAELGPPVAVGLVVLVGWEAVVRVARIPPVLLPGPTDIAAAFPRIIGDLSYHALATGTEAAIAFLISAVLGALIAAALSSSTIAFEAVYPHLVLFQVIPKIALAPLFIIWFGIGMWSKVALAATMVFFLVFYNVYSGVRAVDRDLVDLARVMGANERQLTRHVYLPAASPFIILGMRMAIPYSVIGVIVGEFTSSMEGLGLFIHEASATYDPAGVFAGITILLAFIIVANIGAGALERRVLNWRTPMAGRPADI